MTVEDYGKWKRDAMNRLQAHFETESQAADAVQAFFGETVGRSLTFFNVLSRRYDVVVANPPYMGSKNMGEAVKRFVETNLKAGKRDLYAAFVLQCIKMAAVGGSVAMVTMNKWLHARAFAPLRCGRDLSATGIEKGERSPLNILFSNRLYSLADLGSRAFDPENQFHDGVQVALFIIGKNPPVEKSSVAIIDCTAPRDPGGKSRALLQALSARDFSRTLQKRFIDLPGSPLCYKLSDELLGKIGQATRLGLLARVRQGICTTHDPRFVRMFWEISLGHRWKVFAKGGGHKRWDGLRHFTVDWEHDGSRIKDYITDTPHAIHWSGRMPESEYYFKGGWCFSRIAFGSLGVRKFRDTDLFGHTNPVILFGSDSGNDEINAAVGLLNSSLTTYLLRAITQSNDFPEGYLRRFPWPKLQSSLIPFASEVTNGALDSAADITSTVLTEVTFDPRPLEGRSFSEFAASQSRFRLEREFTVCSAEAVFQQLGYLQWDLSASDIALVERTMGTLEIPTHTSELPQKSSFLQRAVELAIGRIIQPNPCVPENLKQQAKEYLEGEQDAEPLAVEENDLSDEAEETDEESTELPMPPFGDVDAFARNAAIDIATSYLALRATIDAGFIGDARRRTETLNFVSKTILRLLGHRWPKQIEVEERLPVWADQDGIIPLTSGGGEMPLIERVRERLAEDFPGGHETSLEHEFEEIVGVPLEKWLAGPFYERHISQFKKRPIAWQLETVASRRAGVPGGKGKKKRGVAGKPVFACLVYYHKLDVDLLPKIRTQYVGLLCGGFETEFRTLEGLANPTGDQQTRRLQLEQWIDELQTFDRLLEDVSLRGFGPDALHPALRQYGINDALLSLTASWLRRLSETVVKGPMSDWEEAATKTDLHPDLPKWLRDSMSNLNHFCAVLGPKPPDETSLATDPTSKELAPLVCHQAKSMVETSLKLGCDRWWTPLDAAVLEPLRQEIKTAKSEIEKIDEELKAEGLLFQRRNELGERKHELKVKVKSIKADHDEKSDRARKVRDQIEKWVCPEAETWEAWLCAQPLFDPVASLDGQRPPPQSIAGFITQESRYAPDINDGVRVNIAPIQKAGLLHADVLDAKDADKAIADRAEWRADERRWVREGKLPQPGWWTAEETEAHS